MTIRFGVRGTIDYTAQKAGLTTGTPLLSYSARGDMGADASLKTGTYRLSAVGMLPSTSYVGECESVNLLKSQSAEADRSSTRCLQGPPRCSRELE